MCFCHAIILAAVRDAVMIANSPLFPRIRAAWSINVVPIPWGVGLRIRVPGDNLDPFLASLAQHGRHPLPVLDSDRDDVDAAGDPSFGDLVLLGRVRVGGPIPDQLDAQLPGRLLRPLAASDE